MAAQTKARAAAQAKTAAAEKARAASARAAAAQKAKKQAFAPPRTPGDTYYQNCTAVRAAGVDPIYAGQPGYSLKLDRDGDGVACE